MNPSRRSGLIRCATCVTVAVSAFCLAVSGAFAYPNPGTIGGDTLIHDPSMVINPFPGATPHYIVYGTKNNNSTLNSTLTSQDRVTFTGAGHYFGTSTPSWWNQYNGGDGEVWAPDVSFHDGQYWMYYAVSTQGSQHSAIGLATSPTGLPGTWTDRASAVIDSQSADPDSSYNAIDPQLLVDNTSAPPRWYLVFGSFFGGIFITQLDPTTGLRKDPNAAPTQIAARPGVQKDPIEAPFVYQHVHNGVQYYYLFTSWNYCCNGDPATDNYSIHVGRSTDPTGQNPPYTDEAGTSLLNGGGLDASGNPVLASHDYVRAPGGQSVYFDNYLNDHDLLIYHYLDSRLNYGNFLGINFLCWDGSGFPQAC